MRAKTVRSLPMRRTDPQLGPGKASRSHADSLRDPLRSLVFPPSHVPLQQSERLIKTPITNFSLESQQVLRTIRPTMPVFEEATTPVAPIQPQQ